MTLTSDAGLALASRAALLAGRFTQYGLGQSEERRWLQSSRCRSGAFDGVPATSTATNLIVS